MSLFSLVMLAVPATATDVLKKAILAHPDLHWA